MITTLLSLSTMLASVPAAMETVPADPQPIQFGFCPTEPADIAFRGGGMAGTGWDGPGQNSTTIRFHIENYSNDLPAREQRDAYIFALSLWANVVQIDFVEIAAPNWNRSIDFRWATGSHCAVESAECGDADCPFDGTGGILAHAGFPPGVNSLCIDPMPETFAGNVHFDDADFYEQNNAGSGMSLMLIAAHEIGHAIGLTHDTGPGGPHIMRPSFNGNEGIQAPSASDRSHLQGGYAAGVGSVQRLEDSGIWVNSAYEFQESGLAGDPFNTIAEAVNALPPQNYGITIHVIGGFYPGPHTIAEPCTITAELNTAYIGR